VRTVRGGGAAASPPGTRTPIAAPYEVLDPILQEFIEEDLSVDEIAKARGSTATTAAKVLDW